MVGSTWPYIENYSESYGHVSDDIMCPKWWHSKAGGFVGNEQWL